MQNTCPFCHGERLKNIDGLKQKLRPFVQGESVDPCGRELRLISGRSIRLQGQCNACDEHVLRRAWNEERTKSWD